MARTTKSIPIYFPDQTESDRDSFYEELPDYTANDTKHSRASSTSGCFGWIRRWIREKASRKSTRDPESTAAGDDASTEAVDGDSTAPGDDASTEIADCDSRATDCDDASTEIADGDSRATDDDAGTEIADGDSTASDNCDSDRNEDTHSATSSRGDVDYRLYDRLILYTVLNRETPVQMNLKDAAKEQDVWRTHKKSNYCNLHGGKENNEDRQSMELSEENQGMEEAKNEETRSFEVAEKKQEQWEENKEASSLQVTEENEDKVEQENGGTLSLQASELKEKELSAPEGRHLDTSVEQAHMELDEHKTDRQMKKLEKENRRQRKILTKLTEERGEQLDQEFEPLRMQDAPSQKNYMRRIKKQSTRIEEIIKKLRAKLPALDEQEMDK